jgi:MoaA/NifB/PqqE/SkfB family radical SAM enzyme
MKKNKNDNLIPQAHKLTVEEASRGGKASAEARREKKTVKKILTDLMDANIEEMPRFAELAEKLGITGDKSIKDLFVMVCVFNNLEKGNIYDLEKLAELLNEDGGNSSGILEDILSAVRGI